jgi:predicted porin
MMMGKKLRPAALAVAMALGATMAVPLSAYADGTQDEINALKEQLRVLNKKLEDLSRKQEKQEQKQEKIEQTVSSSGGGSADRVSQFMKGFYGVLDVSFDDTTKGMGGMTASHWGLVGAPGSGYVNTDAANGGLKAGPVGRVGWMPAFSTNKSGLGYRGDHLIADTDVKFIYQIEASMGITAAPGVSTSYTAQGANVSGTLGTGNTFIGLAKGGWGSIKFGTTYAPYKNATDRLNPFSGMLGDYAVVMGNTGGDNRVEFGTRLEHSVWYESPKWSGFSFDLLYSPGQNRTYDNVVQSAGSSNCNGGNIPGSGNLPLNCDDGGFNNAFSAALKYETKKFYATAAYELHQGVNRNSDGIGANNPIYGYYAGLGGAAPAASNLYIDNATQVAVLNGAAPGAIMTIPLGAYTTDIANEWALKIGAQYKFDFGLTVSGILERMRREVPAYLQFQNERSRDGSWLALTQTITPKDEVSIGWAHAGSTPGDPGGQHNYDPTRGADTADMYTVAYKRKLDKSLYWYVDAATTINHGNAHYDLGAGGRGLTTDCHDGTNNTYVDYTGAGPTTWGGCHEMGISTGLHYSF